MQRYFFVTGTDTAVGKTVFTFLFARHLHRQGTAVAALKPLCSGGRADAEWLHKAIGGDLSLDEINPWYFNAPLSPRVAAKAEKQRVTLTAVQRHIRRVTRSHSIIVVEGAGGLLSPMGHDFDSRDLIRVLGAIPIVVSLNRLGVVNQVRLVLEALPPGIARKAHVVLMTPRRPELSVASNIPLLFQYMPRERLHALPWTNWKRNQPTAPVQRLLTNIFRKIF